MGTAKGQEPRQGHHQGEGDAHPRLLGKPPAGPSRRVQNRGDVRDGGHGDPAQVEAEGRVHKPALPGTRGPQPTPQVEVDGDEGGQKRAHGHEGEGKPLVVPEEDPGRIGQVGGEEPGAHPGQPGVLPHRGAELVNGERQDPHVNQAPHRKDVPRRDEVHRKPVGDLPGLKAVQGKGVGGGVYRDCRQGAEQREPREERLRSRFHPLHSMFHEERVCTLGQSPHPRTPHAWALAVTATPP